MNGKRYFLDTNAIVQLLAGNPDVADILRGASSVLTSVICELEFLAFPKLSRQDKRLFGEFMKRVTVVDVCSSDSALKERLLEFRATRRLKLPDAIIVASASVHQCTLLTADGQLLNIEGVPARQYRPM